MALLWSAMLLAAGLLMVGVYLVKAERDKNVVEVGALALMSVAVSVYLVTLAVQATTIEGIVAIVAALASIVINFVGRGVLLVRQLRYARKARLAGRLDSGGIL